MCITYLYNMQRKTLKVAQQTNLKDYLSEKKRN